MAEISARLGVTEKPAPPTVTWLASRCASGVVNTTLRTARVRQLRDADALRRDAGPENRRRAVDRDAGAEVEGCGAVEGRELAEDVDGEILRALHPAFPDRRCSASAGRQPR